MRSENSPFESGAASFVRNHAPAIAQLPNPDGSDPRSDDEGWFLDSRQPDAASDVIGRLAHHDLIERGHRGRDESGHRWRLKTHTYERAVECAENINYLPCYHTGIRNVRGGGFECRECGREITREQAEAVIG